MKHTFNPLTAFVISALLIGCSMANGAAPDIPLPSMRSRPVALSFGMYVTPDAEHNPIDPPERFTGYHVARDFEILQSELHEEVPVYAICGGSVLYSGYADGYGGVLLQRCQLKGEDVTVIYGHLDSEGLVPEGIAVMTGDLLGYLAADNTLWSGWNRKHLHLGIRKGEVSDIRGYVQSADEISSFIDPLDVLPKGAAGRTVKEFHVVRASQEP